MLLQKKCCPIVASMYLGMYAVESLKDLIFGFSKDFSILHIRFSRIG